jgi:hypothetical protein
MYLISNKIITFLLLFSLTTSTGFANSSIEFFASNNTKEINLPTAYERLAGKKQLDLQNSIIDIMQENHIEQGKEEAILGTYQMSSDQHITADNSEHFRTSPKQPLSDDKVFSLAKELAIHLKQESVAVFIPNQSTIGNITVSFTSHQPTIDEIINIIHEKLPHSYSQAFSMHLVNTRNEFNTVKVSEIEWLGSKIHLEDIQKAFPNEKINYANGNVFLVFQNGQKEPI